MFVDGSCRGNPGPGGWGFLLETKTHHRSAYGHEPDTTNNRMELTAAIKAFEALKYPVHVDVFTDSKYLQQAFTELWLEGWKANGWKTSKKKDVKNRDLWERLDKAIQPHHVTWHWVEGHNGHPGNEEADHLANMGALGGNVDTGACTYDE